MKKNRILSLILAVTILVALLVGSKIEAAKIISNVYTFFVNFPASIITHTPITNVSANTRLLNAKISVDFGCYTSATAKILYYVNGDSANPKEQSAGSISDKEDFFVALPQFSEADTKVDYQIEVTLKVRDEERIMYYPVDSEDNPYYITATILSSSSSVVNGSQGGKVEYESGDQSSGGVSVDIPAGAYDGDDVITIKEIDPNRVGAPARVQRHASSKSLKAYEIAKGGSLDATFDSPVKVTFEYPDMKSGDKFVIKRGATESTVNETLTTTVDHEAKTVSAMASKSGIFALYFAATSNNDYKPSRRVIVKARAESRGDVFQFNCLTEGDSVKIYNVNGKKVRELKGGSFAWDGKDDNGRYVESGTYIYQIKVDGKVISGTIAFVK